ncbi:hypothetical protein ACFQ2J_10360 [Thalassobacillus hwangdonensis]|uniref:Uncharacterized protein n=1 Tax=Thalassobacillus hwangdonensis TaxID=546108 RepID=A0ABW3L0G8_9BACI
MIDYIDDKKLNKAVHEELEERVGNDDFTILFVQEVEFDSKYKENQISVGYTIDDEPMKYWGWYFGEVES